MGGINTIGSTEKIWYKDMEGIQAYLQKGGGAVSGSGHMHIAPVPSVNGMGYCLCTIQNKRGIVSERWCCQLGTHRSRVQVSFFWGRITWTGLCTHILMAIFLFSDFQCGRIELLQCFDVSRQGRMVWLLL